MPTKYSNLLFTKGTPQTSPLPSSSPQVQNNAGGFVFSLSKWKRLERFLILGSDSNTYYQKAEKLTKENAEIVNECWSEDAGKTSLAIVEISLHGRAARNSPAIFALALGAVHPNLAARQAAFGSVLTVCRTASHLFEFVEATRSLGKGYGRGLKNAIANWYNNRSDDSLAYQLVKYRKGNSNTLTHERLIRVSHPKTSSPSPARRAMYDWLRNRTETRGDLPELIMAHEAWMKTDEKQEFLGDRPVLTGLPWEALPKWALSRREVWWEMIKEDCIPLTALIRNLGNMTRHGVFDLLTEHGTFAKGFVIGRLTSLDHLRRARIHPFSLLNALKTYSEGKGFRGTKSWSPDHNISIALEKAFHKSFSTITPSGKKIILALDISPSMKGAMLMNSSLSAREASAAMAMATINSEEFVHSICFSSLYAHNQPGGAVSPIAIEKGEKLSNVMARMNSFPYAGTDCSLPMLYAIQHQLPADAFIVYTDNETFAGQIHAVEALRMFRTESGIADAKLIVVGMTSTGFSIADPNDENMLDVVGFDTTAPSVIANFIRGKSIEDQNEIRDIVETDGESERESERESELGSAGE